ncbi:MAG TPA: hypothetical protein PK239_04460 [Chitinophagales bacterium]|nr:hypothetical protein [Chitinophagales bacterium]
MQSIYLSDIRKYLANKLKEPKLSLIRHKINNSLPFARQALMEKLITDAVTQIADEQSASAMKKAQQLADELEDELFSPDEQKAIHALFPYLPADYSPLQLEAAFAVAEEFEPFTKRSTSADPQKQLIQVLSPEHEANVKGNFVIQLQNPLPQRLILTIKNNKGDFILKNHLLPENQTLFTVPLPQLNPGRYYWQLKVNSTIRKELEKYGIILRSFFIRKDLYIR